MPKITPIQIVKLLALAVVIGLGIWLGRFVSQDHGVREAILDFGYLGILLVAYGSGFNLVVPIPAATFTPAFTAAGFDFWTVIFIMTFGLTAADLTAFLIGRFGRGFRTSPLTGWGAKIERFHAAHPKSRAGVLFLFAAFVPIPNEVLLVPMGFLGARIRDVILPVLCGNFVFNALASGSVLALDAVL